MILFLFAFFDLISVCIHVGQWECYLSALIFSVEHIRNSERHFILGDKYLPLLLQVESRSMIKSHCFGLLGGSTLYRKMRFFFKTYFNTFEDLFLLSCSYSGLRLERVAGTKFNPI